MFAYCGGLCAVPSAAVLPAIPQDGTPYTEADNCDSIHPALQTFAQKMRCGGKDNPAREDFAKIADSRW